MDEKDFFNRKIIWKSFGEFEGFRYSLLYVDLEKRVVDLLFQFDANQRCFYHRHYHPTSSLVLYGEHHIYEPKLGGGENHKVRKAGQFAISTGQETHIEGAGDIGCTIYQNVRAESDLVYSVLNSDLTIKMDISIRDFHNDFLKAVA